MPTDPEYKLYPALFSDNVARRSIVVSGYLTQAENNAMKARAQAAGMTQAEFLQDCLMAGIQNAIVSNNQTPGSVSSNQTQGNQS
jgi:hypothetical protein